MTTRDADDRVQICDASGRRAIDVVGTLEPSDTGRRCANLPEDGEIVAIRCAKCGDEQFLGKNLAFLVWGSMKATDGWHSGCVPEARERRAALLARIQDSVVPGDSCPVCARLDCSGSATAPA